MVYLVPYGRAGRGRGVKAAGYQALGLGEIPLYRAERG